MTDDVLLNDNGIGVEVARLWAERAPGAEGDNVLDIPVLSVHLPDEANGCAMIVCPGGGYRSLASDHEGLQVARWLNGMGIAAFVLRYRLGPTYHSSVSLLDAQRAIRYVRTRAAEFGIAAERVGMLGFSAGGHLSCAAATAWDGGNPNDVDPVEREGCRPDFIVPIYAVTNGAKRGRKADEYHPVDEAVSERTPPAFIVTTHEDITVPANQSTLFYDAMLAANVGAELHIFNDGEHGLGLMPGDPDAGQWTQLLARWLRRRGFLTNSPRIAVLGSLLIDEAAPANAWITFLPEEHNQPLGRARITGRSAGLFEIFAAGGPTAGWHEMQVHLVSAQFPYTGTGAYTLAAVRRYSERVRLQADMRLELRLASADFKDVS